MLFAQGNYDIYLLDIKHENGQWHFSNPVNVSKHKGYDNQPSFSSNGKYLYYTSLRDTLNNTTDIYRYEIASGKTIRLTHTPASSEYSPRETPDKKYISVVMVEKDGKTQRLWKFDLNGKKAQKIAPKIDSVGYYVWINKDTIAAFILGTNNFNHSLRLLNIQKQTEKTIADSIGRCIKTYKNNRGIFFIRKTTDTTLYALPLSNLQPVRVNKVLNGAEDFVYHNERFFMARNNELYEYWLIAKFSYWKKNNHFNFTKLNNITRIVISPDGSKMALVAADDE
jgi:tricorn protease-like protein